MYTIYIVDDEASIREGIASSIPWASLGYGVGGTFANGFEALAAIRREAPDVLLTDIRMPLVDGVELMKTVSGEYPSVKIVVLSGYSDLEYLRTAIQNRAADYLLKPTKKANIITLFQRLRGELDEERQRNMDLQTLREQSSAARQLQQTERLRLYLRGIVDAQTIRQNESIYGDDELPLFHCRVMLATPDGRLGDDEGTLFRLKQTIVDILNEQQNGGVFLLSQEDIITGLLPATSAEALDDFLGAVQRLVHERTGSTISVGVSEMCDEPGRLNWYYEQARCSMQQSVFLGPQTVFHYQSFEQQATEISAAIDIEALKSGILSGDMDVAGKALGAYFESFRNKAIKQYAYIDQHCLETLLHLARWSANFGVRLEEVMESLGAQYADIYKCDSLDQKHLYLEAVFCALQDAMKQGVEQANKTKSLAHYLQQIVDEEYADYNLSLDYVADKLQKTPGHISKIFRAEIGKTFYDYVLQRRLEAACGFLKDPSVKVYEVAGLVGYNSSSSFIRVFKSHFGMTPNDYRFMHINAGEEA